MTYGKINAHNLSSARGFSPIISFPAKTNRPIISQVLKKRCRDFGIPRWPHRKIKSIKVLIDNIKELADPQDSSSVDAASVRNPHPTRSGGKDPSSGTWNENAGLSPFTSHGVDRSTFRCSSLRSIS